VKKIIIIFILISTIFLLSCESNAEDTKDIEDLDPDRLREIQKHKKYISENTLPAEMTEGDAFYEALNNNDLLYVAGIPEKDIYLYGYYSSDIMLFKYGDRYEIFDYWCLTPRLIFPEMFLYDYDNDGKEELAVKIYQASGTGISLWSLMMIEISEEAEQYQYEDIFYKFNYTMLGYDEISDMVYQYIETNGGMETELDGIDISCINSIDIQEKLTVRLMIGYITEGAAAPEYTDAAVYAELIYKNGGFSVNKTWIDDFTWD